MNASRPILKRGLGTTVVSTGLGLSLGQAVLETTTATEGATTDGTHDDEHEGEEDPSEPAEGVQGLERVAVVVARGTTAGAEGVSQSTGTGQPEDPSQEQPDSVTGNRGDNTANTSQEESKLQNGRRGERKKVKRLSGSGHTISARGFGLAWRTRHVLVPVL